MIRVKPYLIQGFLELFVAAQAPPHRTPLEIRKPAFPHGIPACCGGLEKAAHGNLCSLLLAWTENQLRYIAVERQVLDLRWLVTGPLCFHEFCSSYFHQVARFITARVNTDCARESPLCTIYSKVLMLSMSWQKHFGFSRLVSWLSNKYHLLYRIPPCTFAQSNSAEPIPFLYCRWLAEFACT